MSQAKGATVEVDPATYVAMFKRGKAPPDVISGVCGRVVRGRSEGDFAKLAFTDGRQFAWVTGPDGLRDMIGRSHESIVLGIGRTRAWLHERLAEGMHWRLIVLPQIECVRADWDGVFMMIEKGYPEVSSKLLRWRTDLQDQKLTDSIGPERVTDAIRKDVDHAEHMSVARYLTCEDTAPNARLFLWHSLGLNQHFVGDGWAIDPETEQRMEEYLAPNVMLDTIPGHCVIRLDVGSASTPA